MNQQPTNTNPPASAAPPTMEQEPATQNTVPAQPVQASPVPSFGANANRNRKLPLVAIIIAVVLLLLGGAAAVYAFWYQNPERAVHDSISQFVGQKYMSTQTEVTSDSALSTGAATLKVTKLAFNTKSGDAPQTAVDAKVTIEFNGNAYDLAGDMRLDQDGTIYFRINDVTTTVEKMMRDFDMADGDDLPAPVREQLEYMQNKWVKVQASDMGDAQKAYTCMIDAIRTHGASDETMKFARDKYEESKFLVVKERVGSENGAIGYKVDFNNDAFKKYMEATNDSPLGKALSSCDTSSLDGQTSATNPENIFENTSIQMTVWVARFGHQLQKVDYVITAKSPQVSNEVVFKGVTAFTYDKPTIDIPTDSVDFKEWSEKLNESSSMLAPAASGPSTAELDAHNAI